MNNSKDMFRKGLLGAEKKTPGLQEQYRKEMEKMFDEKLSTSKKWGLGALAFLRGGIAIVIIYIVVTNTITMPLWAIVIFFALAIFLLFLAGFNACLVWRGSWNLKSHFNLSAWLKYGFLLALAGALILIGTNYPQQQVALFCAAIFLTVLATMVIIYNKVHQSELKTREKLLEIECQLAALSEKLDK